MGRATITFVFNPKTGKREWHIDYQSEPDLTRVEHEQAHRRLVRNLVGSGVLANDETDVERGSPEAPHEKPTTAEREEEPRLRERVGKRR